MRRMGSVNISMPVAPDIGGGWKETDWDKLLINIEAGTVIPIIGRDLLYVSPDGKKQPVLLYNILRRVCLKNLVRKFLNCRASQRPIIPSTMRSAFACGMDATI